jgi:predicted transcriptional regulator of viral defense system
MAKQFNWLIAERKLRDVGASLFTPQDLVHLLLASPVSVRFILTRAVKRGDVLKLRRGLYARLDVLPSDIEVANALYKPSYVSFAFGLSFHRLIPETVYSIASATTRTTAAFTALGKEYSYHHIKRQAFSGYQAQRVNGRTILMAEPEKALVDTLYFVLLGRMTIPDRLNTKRLDANKAVAFAKLYGYRDLTDLVMRTV